MKLSKAALLSFVLAMALMLTSCCSDFWGTPYLTGADIPEKDRIVMYFSGNLTEFNPIEDIEKTVYGNRGEVFSGFRFTGYTLNFSKMYTARLNKNLESGYRVRLRGRHSVGGTVNAWYWER